MHLLKLKQKVDYLSDYVKMEQENKEKEEIIEGDDVIADIAADYAEYLSVESTKEVRIKFSYHQC